MIETQKTGSDNGHCEECIHHFSQLMEKIFEDKPYLLQYAVDLDEKSPVSFDHSVNVAVLIYAQLSKDGSCTPDEIKEYTAAAFGHDVGKLTTPDDALHSFSSLCLFADVTAEQILSERTAKMRHSIDGLGVAKEYGFTAREQFISFSHHMMDACLEAGKENGYSIKNPCYDPSDPDSQQFLSVDQSDYSWKQSFPDGYIVEQLGNMMPYVTSRDIEMTELVSYMNLIENCLSKSCAYQGELASQREWESFDKMTKEMVQSGEANKKFLPYPADKGFTDSVDQYMRAKVYKDIRTMVYELQEEKETAQSCDGPNKDVEEDKDGEWFFGID